MWIFHRVQTIKLVDILMGKSFSLEFSVLYNKTRCRHEYVCSSGLIYRQYLATKNWRTLLLYLLLACKIEGRKINETVS